MNPSRRAVRDFLVCTDASLLPAADAAGCAELSLEVLRAFGSSVSIPEKIATVDRLITAIEVPSASRGASRACRIGLAAGVVLGYKVIFRALLAHHSPALNRRLIRLLHTAFAACSLETSSHSAAEGTSHPDSDVPWLWVVWNEKWEMFAWLMTYYVLTLCADPAWGDDEGKPREGDVSAETDDSLRACVLALVSASLYPVAIQGEDHPSVDGAGDGDASAVKRQTAVERNARFVEVSKGRPLRTNNASFAQLAVEHCVGCCMTLTVASHTLSETRLQTLVSTKNILSPRLPPLPSALSAGDLLRNLKSALETALPSVGAPPDGGRLNLSNLSHVFSSSKGFGDLPLFLPAAQDPRPKAASAVKKCQAGFEVTVREVFAVLCEKTDGSTLSGEDGAAAPWEGAAGGSEPCAAVALAQVLLGCFPEVRYFAGQLETWLLSLECGGYAPALHSQMPSAAHHVTELFAVCPWIPLGLELLQGHPSLSAVFTPYLPAIICSVSIPFPRSPEPIARSLLVDTFALIAPEVLPMPISLSLLTISRGAITRQQWIKPLLTVAYYLLGTYADKQHEMDDTDFLLFLQNEAELRALIDKHPQSFWDLSELLLQPEARDIAIVIDDD
ncbi:hypothetical protein DIPPA_12557 [Diplonema papillatum]|nr:hypothetical protein DIPPA_12557 [Diplonema papillatum]|eukprot:gene13393-20617_t